jgi:membrane protease YdiL (CAAX protease family)
MFFLIERFAVWDGTTLERLGVQYDDRTIRRIIIGAVAGLASTTLITAFAFFFGGQLRPPDEITSDLILSEIIITTPTAFFEELAYRGYILPKMENLSGKTSAILLSSLFFSSAHFSWWTYPGIPFQVLLIFIFNIFLGGVVLSLGYYWSNRNLWVPIAFHFAWNMAGYLMFPSYPQEQVVSPGLFQFEWGLTTIVGFLFGLSLIYSLLLENKNKKHGQ